MSNRSVTKKKRPTKEAGKRRYQSDLRSEAKDQTRDALVRAAIAAFAEEGLDASIDAICARAGYSRGAFYAHFTDRDALIAAAMKAQHHATLDTMLTTLGEGAVIRGLVEMLGQGLEAGVFPPTGRVRSAEFVQACRRSDELRDAHHALLGRTAARLSEIARSDQDAGNLRPDVDATSLGTLLVLVEAGLELMADLGWTYDVRAVVACLTRMLEAWPVTTTAVRR